MPQAIEALRCIAPCKTCSALCLLLPSKQALAPLLLYRKHSRHRSFPLQAVQWLRHGCLPVIVAEGLPPAEKQSAQQARFAARKGYAGGGTKAGAAQFQRLGKVVGQLLEELVSRAERGGGWGSLLICPLQLCCLSRHIGIGRHAMRAAAPVWLLLPAACSWQVPGQLPGLVPWLEVKPAAALGMLLLPA
jgi:hypothetical protein